MHIRLATMDDAEMLLQWRNDPFPRANSFATDQVPLERARQVASGITPQPSKTGVCSFRWRERPSRYCPCRFFGTGMRVVLDCGSGTSWARLWEPNG